MTATATDVTTSIAPRRLTRSAGITLAIVALVAVALLSLAIGAKPIPLSTVIDSLLHPSDTQDSVIITDLRVPRTILGLLVGAALGLAGALMQALTRNPLADPGLLGVNAGAAAAVIVAIAVLGLTGITAYVWFAFLGAAIASVVVYAIGTGGPRRRDPGPARARRHGDHGGAHRVHLRRSRSATRTCCSASASGSSARSPGATPDGRARRAVPARRHRCSRCSSPGRSTRSPSATTPRGRSAPTSGARASPAPSRSRCCAAPPPPPPGRSCFVGLTIPHVARAIVGPDQRWVLPYSALLGPVLLLGADVLGRVVARPGELEVGIVTAMLGAPVFIALVRRRRIAQL